MLDKLGLGKVIWVREWWWEMEPVKREGSRICLCRLDLAARNALEYSWYGVIVEINSMLLEGAKKTLGSAH